MMLIQSSKSITNQDDTELAAEDEKEEYYDLKHGAANVGSVVLRKNFTRKRRKGEKLEYRWQTK